MDPAPLDDPLSYPGVRAAWPFRLHDADLQQVADDDPLFTRPGRTAVLAIGSNASPAQLARKFRGQRCDAEIVGCPVTVAGLQIRPSAHLGRSGYWPFAPVALDVTASPAVLCLFDDEQLAVLDATEPNYDRIALDPTRHPLTGLPPRLPAAPVHVYASRHGIVDDPRLPSWSDPPPSQESLLTAVLPLLRQGGAELPAAAADARTLSRALRSEAGLAGRLTDVLKRTVVVRHWP